MPYCVADFRERGVTAVLRRLADDLARTLALMGVPTAGQLTPTLVIPTPRHDSHVKRRAVAA